MPPPHRNGRLIRVLLVLVCVLTVMIAVVLVVTLVGRDRHEMAAQSPTATTTSTPATPHEHATVKVSALDGLLPDKVLISSAVAAPGIGLVVHGEGIDAEDLVDADCQGMVSVASRAYAGSGWTAIRWQHWNNPPENSPTNLTNHVSLSVTAYPQANAARAFYLKQSDAWRKCAGHIVNGHPASAKEFTGRIWIIDNVTASDRVLAATAINFDSRGASCRTMLTVRNNIAVRVTACAFTDQTAAAQTLLDSITAKIDAAA